jgi:acyl-coenzyme A thioesterase PaaI-like protein
LIHQQPTCFGCGPENPTGLRGTYVADRDQVRGSMVVTESMVGAPGRLHGGIMMAFLDEAMGLVCFVNGVAAMAANLNIDLRAPVFVGASLEQRAWLERQEGRKWFVRGEVFWDGRLVAEARGLWIVPR